MECTSARPYNRGHGSRARTQGKPAMRCTLLCAGLVLAGLTALVACRSEAKPTTEGSGKDGAPALTLNVWPDKPPGDKEGIAAEKVEKEKPGERKLTRITNVTQPTL